MLLLTSKNIEFYSTFLSSAVDVRERVIYFGPGVADEEKLLEVPIGEVAPHATIVITVGLNKSHPNDASADSDPAVGISDGTYENLIWIIDVNGYPRQSPCFARNSSRFDDTRVTAGTPVPATFKLTFTPFNKFGFCETAQDGGYINTFAFNAQMDITKALFLTVRRHQIAEQYYYHYFKVEIYEG